MASPKNKTTYSLDAETVSALERIARLWKVSKSEVLRRAIRAVANGEITTEEDPTRALDRLQEALDIGDEAARRWEESTRDERTAWSQSREDR